MPTTWPAIKHADRAKPVAHQDSRIPGRFNHQLKIGLPNKRLNVSGIHRVQRRLIAHFLAKNLEAALAWHERTSGDISHLFAQPPPGTQHAA